MIKKPEGFDGSTTTYHSQEPAELMDNKSTNKYYKKIFSQNCKCPYNCYLCCGIVHDFVIDIYKRDCILIKSDKSIFCSILEKGGFVWLSSEEVLKDLIDQINTLKKSNAISYQRQDCIETKLDRIIEFLKNRKVRERKRPY